MESVAQLLNSLLTTNSEWSPETLASELGVSALAVNRWLKGETKPRPLVEGKLREIHNRAKTNSHLSENRGFYFAEKHIDESYVRDVIDSTLIELREALHRYGRLSSRNEALNELSKLLFAHIMTDGGISKQSVLGDITNGNAAQLLADFVRNAFKTYLPESLGYEMEIKDFELGLKPQENVLAMELLELFEQMTRKSEDRGINSFRGLDVLNDVFGKFLTDSFANEKQLGQYLTPTEVVKFMTRMAIEDMAESDREKLLDPNLCAEFGIILDPSCGVGSFLTEVLRHLYAGISTSHSPDVVQSWLDSMVSKVLVGIDKSERMIKLALTNMATFGLPSAQLHLANSLAKTGRDSEIVASMEGKVRLILTNPPFGAEFRGNDLQSYKVAMGESGKRLSKVNSEVLFIERYVDLLVPGGQFLAIVPDSILTNKGVYEALRRQLSDRVQIRSVVSLPAITFAAAGTSTKTSILHIRKVNPTQGERYKTFFAICNDIGYNVRTRNTQRTKTSTGNGTGELPAIFTAFTSDNSHLNHSRFIEGVENATRWDVNYHLSLSPEVESKIQSSSQDDVFVSTVATLVNDKTDPRRWGSGTFKYIEISDIDGATCTVRTQQIRCADAPSRARKLVRTGDVLVSTVRPERRTVGVVRETQDGAICSTGLAVLRPHGIASLLLAYLLKTDLVTNQILRNTLGIAYPAIEEGCLPDILLPICRKDIESLTASSNDLLALECRIDEAREALNADLHDSIFAWESGNLGVKD